MTKKVKFSCHKVYFTGRYGKMLTKKIYENIALYSVTLTRTISFYSCDIKCDKFNGISFVRVHKAGIYSHLKHESWYNIHRGFM